MTNLVTTWEADPPIAPQLCKQNGVRITRVGIAPEGPKGRGAQGPTLPPHSPAAWRNTRSMDLWNCSGKCLSTLAAAIPKKSKRFLYCGDRATTMNERKDLPCRQ